VTPEEIDQVRKLLTRHMNTLSLAESLAISLLDRAEPGRRESVARTLEMLESWEQQAEKLWGELGLERRKTVPTVMPVDVTVDRRRSRKKKDRA
jgi:hypothetical protein